MKGIGMVGAKLAAFVRAAPWAVVCIILLAVVLAALPLLLLPASVSNAHTTITSVSSVVVLVFALFGLIDKPFTPGQIVVALVIVTVVVTAGLLVWRAAEQSRALTVTDEVELADEVGMGNGDTAVLTVTAPAPRDRLRLTVDADEHGIGSPCAPMSLLRITGEGPGAPVEARIGEDRETMVDLAEGDRSIRLELELDTDPHCRLSLRVTKAVLDNGRSREPR
ncbi:hypothetical protein [Streptomyces macrosporus]|uniref:Uncharacterized protein n=1 Tax=Streptomyces macrosporus TaxID=44032 RepID=A0ABP5WQQ4_9ACTN